MKAVSEIRLVPNLRKTENLTSHRICPICSSVVTAPTTLRVVLLADCRPIAFTSLIDGEQAITAKHCIINVGPAPVF